MIYREPSGPSGQNTSRIASLADFFPFFSQRGAQAMTIQLSAQNSGQI